MANLRGSSSSYEIGNTPPTVIWTVVKGDTSGFKVYATDDAKDPLNIPDWTISMKFKRPTSTPGIITDTATDIFTLTPHQDEDDAIGEFTVWLNSAQSVLLRTGDVFDIQLSDATRVWTICQGSMKILEDVTD